MSDKDDQGASKIRRRGGIRATTTTDMKKADAMLQGAVAMEVSKLRTLRARLQHNLSRLYDLDAEIQEVCAPDQADSEVASSEKYNDGVLTTIVAIDDWLLQQPQPTAGLNSSGGNSGQMSASVKLPKFEMSKYSGDPMGWFPFWDVFRAAVHENQKLSAVEKFTYLLGYLDGDALAVASGYSLTTANYAEVVEALQDRFGNRQRAQSAHFQALIALEPARNKTLTEVRRVWDKCEMHIRSLVALDVKEDTFAVVFTSIIITKLPEYLATKLCEKTGKDDWSLAKFREWVKDDIRARELGESNGAGSSGKFSQTAGSSQGQRKAVTTASALSVPSGRPQKGGTKTCPFCAKPNHSPKCCRMYPTVDSRFSLVQENRACFVCLRQGHRAGTCELRDKPCQCCGKTGHHISLCRSQENTFRQNSSGAGKQGGMPKAANDSAAPQAPKQITQNVAVSLGESYNLDAVFLETAIAPLQPCGQTGPAVTGRLIFDSASSRSFITDSCRRKLGLETIGHVHISSGRFATRKRKTRTAEIVKLDVLCRDGTRQPLVAMVTNVVTCPVSRTPIDREKYPVVENIPLAEPWNEFPDELEIDVLVGSDQKNKFIYLTGAIQVEDLVFTRSRLGYVTSGTTPDSEHNGGSPHTTLVHVLLRPSDVESEWDFDVERFWQVEDVGVKEKKGESVTDEEALRQFQETVERRDDGRYYVTWPWRSEEPDLPDNYGLALGRLKSALSKLQQDDKLLREYCEIFRMQAEKGIIERAPVKPEGTVYYLPHHPVITPSKTTTKVRIVFDASSKARRDLPSLNDCLHRGPVMLDNLVGLLLRFRTHQVALTSDIEKAFLQVRLKESQRDVARFVWVEDPEKPPAGKNLVFWRFTSVFFGAVSSPFLLGATIATHLEKDGSPVAKKIRDNLYVDNVITGEDDEEDAIQHYRKAKQLFLGASMNLREFYTNSEVVRESIAAEDRGKSQDPKVLGVKWNLDKDVLSCDVRERSGSDVLRTKRSVVRQVAEIFDPCGWFAPVVLTGKVLIQELWKLNLQWDEKIPSDLCGKWSCVQDQLSEIGAVEIPRHVGCVKSGQLEIHAFCDASQVAVATCVYLRDAEKPDERGTLVFSKTRLAPLKPKQSIPRLELIALVMGARALEYVVEQLRFESVEKFVWTDSQCVLYWLSKEKLDTKFVEKRIKSLRETRDIEFRYVPSAENAADIASRGCRLSELKECHMWWSGPTWLGDRQAWPKNMPGEPEPSVDDTEKIVCTVAHDGTPDAELVDTSEFSSLIRLLRVTAFVKRFIRNVRSKSGNRRSGPLRRQEIEEARLYWEKTAQRVGYPELQRSKTKQLNLFRDRDQLLRCKGRVDSSNLSYNAANPVLLPKCHSFTKLVVKHAHVVTAHSGVAQTLTEVRQRYWVCQGRSAVKGVIRQCRTCRRTEGGPYKIPPQPKLPGFRVQEQVPFTSTGIDYFGHLHVKTGPGKTQKVWVCLFTCAYSRAVHLELVENQSAEEFHLALRRFVASCGCPKLIVSDNASQFKTVEKVLANFWQRVTTSEETADLASKKGIEWKKIPEVAPWMGGFYERLVGSVKRCLKKVLDGRCVNTAELRTVLSEISSVINSRPLLYVEDDVKSTQLCPSDLLGKFRSDRLLGGDNSLPTTGIGSVPAQKVIAQWKRLQALTANFWQHWREAYLTSLREKHGNAAQRNTSQLKPTVGSVVLIKDKLPRAQWRLGKIETLLRSSDGEIRSVTLRLCNGRVLTRPIKLLYPLEMQQDNEADSGSSNSRKNPYQTVPQDVMEPDNGSEFEGFDSQSVADAAERLRILQVPREKTLRSSSGESSDESE